MGIQALAELPLSLMRLPYGRKGLHIIAWALMSVDAVVSGCVRAQAPAADFIVTSIGVGKIRLGMTMLEVTRAYKAARVENTVLLQEGYETPAVKIFDGDELLLIAEFVKGRAFRIRVESERFSTREAIHVGSEYGEVRQRLGEPGTFVADEDGLIALYSTGPTSIALRFLPQPEWDRRFMTDETRIVEVLVLTNKLE